MPSNHKEQVVALATSIETGDETPLAYIDPDAYIQHSLGMGNGLAGLLARRKSLPKGSIKVRIVRMFEDGQFVFTHNEYARRRSPRRFRYPPL